MSRLMLGYRPGARGTAAESKEYSRVSSKTAMMPLMLTTARGAIRLKSRTCPPTLLSGSRVSHKTGSACTAHRRAIAIFGAVAAAAQLAAAVTPARTAAAENSSILMGIQRYRQRQYLSDKDQLSEIDIQEAVQGWQLALEMIENAAIRGDTIYLRSALTSGVLDFPTLDAVMDNLKPCNQNRQTKFTDDAEDWRQSAKQLKELIAKRLALSGSTQDIVQSVAVSRAALKPIQKAVEEMVQGKSNNNCLQ